MIKMKYLTSIILGITVITGAYAGGADSDLSLKAVKNVLKTTQSIRDHQGIVISVRENKGKITPRNLMLICLSLGSSNKTVCTNFVKAVILEHNKLVESSPYANDQDCLVKAKKIDTYGMMYLSPTSQYIDIITQHNDAVDAIDRSLADGWDITPFHCSKLVNPTAFSRELHQHEAEIYETIYERMYYIEWRATPRMSDEDLVNIIRSEIMKRLPYIEEHSGPLVCYYAGDDEDHRYVECYTDTIKKHKFGFYKLNP